MTTEEECYQSDCTDESFSYYKPEYVEFKVYLANMKQILFA